MGDAELLAAQQLMVGLLFFIVHLPCWCAHGMCLPYAALANSISSNYPLLLRCCEVPANNERFAGGSYEALLLALLFAGTLWWQLDHGGAAVVQTEGHGTGQGNKNTASVYPDPDDSCGSGLHLTSEWRWVLSSTNWFQASWWLSLLGGVPSIFAFVSF